VNILIAEDEPVSLRRLQYFLEKWGHRVSAVTDGRQALDLFHRQAADMVITDWMMPGMDGLELVRRLREEGRTKPFVYIIFLTSRSDKQGIVQALSEAGVDDYVVKPFDPDELRARVGVGERTVRLERALREYSQGLESVVRWQTRMIRQTQEETIIRLLTALESRDEETGGHVRRIALFSAHLAKAMGWPAGDVDDLSLAAPMHDIGKIGVPDQILRKNGPLTAEEFETIKSHTTTGGEILGNSESSMLQMAHDIALYHHEMWDGTGYPQGLMGGRIPEAARIVALADVFDALSSDRVYRKASAPEQVLEIIGRGRGTHFDPQLFDRFLPLVPELRRIASENP
jgi:putative two-component system response regulator